MPRMCCAGSSGHRFVLATGLCDPGIDIPTVFRMVGVALGVEYIDVVCAAARDNIGALS